MIPFLKEELSFSIPAFAAEAAGVNPNGKSIF